MIFHIIMFIIMFIDRHIGRARSVLLFLGFFAGASTSLPALANQYEIYSVDCRLWGTEQDYEGPPRVLPRTMTLSARFARELHGKEIPQSRVLRIHDVEGQRMASPNFSGIGRASEDCARVGLTLEPVDAAIVRQYLLELGANEVPDLNEAANAMEGKIQFAPIWLSTKSCRRPAATGGILIQAHFDYSRLKGLSYHLMLENCVVRYLDPRRAARSGD